MPGKMHYSLSSSFTSSSLAGECKKAERILDSFINPDIVSLDKRIPRKVLENAKGLAIFTVFEVGMMRSLRFGSGLVVARLANGTWSAPSAIATGKLLAKGQFGMELTDYVYVLNSDTAVENFSQAKTFTLGTDATIAVGPFGRSAELAGDSYDADIFAYCKTKTVFGGSTLEGATMGERADVNRKMYRVATTPRELLRGEVTLPRETYALMKILHSTMLRSPVPRNSSLAKGPTIVTGRKAPIPRSQLEDSVDTDPEVQSEPQHPRAKTPSLSSSLYSSESSSSPTTLSPVTEDNRFYGQIIPSPHRITIEISDYSAVELPPSLTRYPEQARKSLDTQSETSPARCPTVLKPGKQRSWSTSSAGSWSRHDPLGF
ncbi:uncharacterized protein BDV14DRAFT_171700 [Aspergillus stella-maris]|uniref:uncharacterized protein n=1 Tax=Aspergillus stella-maris TaxID=1810926 RepID=UPI003CCDD58B